MSFKPSRLKDMADEIRQQGVADLGEAGFARVCLDFEQRIEADYHRALDILVAGQDGKEIQLALVWLDGQGYSDLALERLAEELFRLRNQKHYRQAGRPRRPGG